MYEVCLFVRSFVRSYAYAVALAGQSRFLPVHILSILFARPHCMYARAETRSDVRMGSDDGDDRPGSDRSLLLDGAVRKNLRLEPRGLGLCVHVETLREAVHANE